MTEEQRITIEMSDITGFEFDCPRCRARFYIPIDKFEEVHHACGNCRQEWFNVIQGPEHLQVNEMLESLKRFRGMTKQPVGIRFHLASKRT